MSSCDVELLYVNLCLALTLHVTAYEAVMENTLEPLLPFSRRQKLTYYP